MIAGAFSEARRDRMKVVARAATYLLDDDLAIDWNDFVLEGEGEKTRFVQAKPARGFLQLTGDDARVSGYGLACEFERQSIRGVWRGYNAFQRVCAAWVEGNRTVVEAVSGENTFELSACVVRSFPQGGGEGRRTSKLQLRAESHWQQGPRYLGPRHRLCAYRQSTGRFARRWPYGAQNNLQIGPAARNIYAEPWIDFSLLRL